MLPHSKNLFRPKDNFKIHMFYKATNHNLLTKKEKSLFIKNLMQDMQGFYDDDIPQFIREDDEMMLKLIHYRVKFSNTNLISISSERINCRDFILEYLKDNTKHSIGRDLINIVDERFWDDEEIMFFAGMKHNKILYNLSPRLKSDKNLIMKIVQNYGFNCVLLFSKMLDLVEYEEIGFDIKFLSEELLYDKDFILQILDYFKGKKKIIPINNPLLHLPSILSEDRDIIVSCIKCCANTIKILNTNCREDILLSLMYQGEFKYVPDHLKDDIELIKIALSKNSQNAKYLNQNTKKDINIVKTAIEICGYSVLTDFPKMFSEMEEIYLYGPQDFGSERNKKLYDNIGPKLNKDIPFLKKLVEIDNLFYYNLPAEMRDNFELLSIVLQKNHEAFKSVRISFRYDEDYVLDCIKLNYRIFSYLPCELRNEKYFIIKALQINENIYYLLDDMNIFSKKVLKQLSFKPKLADIIILYLCNNLQEY